MMYAESEKKLSAMKIKSLKPKDKVFRISDGDGLYLEVKPNGNKYWRFRYRENGKASMLSIGQYPYISLSEARQKTFFYKERLKKGLPVEERKALFKDLVYQWLNKKKTALAPSTLKVKNSIIERDILPYVGHVDIKQIDAPIIIECLLKIEKRSLETARKAKEIFKGVFSYSIALGIVDSNPAALINEALTPIPNRNYPFFNNTGDLAGLLKCINSYHGDFRTKYGLKILIHVFVRPGELRKAEWTEIDFKNRLWIIPAKRMKMKKEHVVPLSEQILSMFKDLYDITNRSRYVFPSVLSMDKPVSDNTFNYGLRRMGYTRDEIVAHGFRHTASTFLHELGFEPHIIEKQLSHEIRNKVARVYNKAEYLEKRKEMMQFWSDYLDNLKAKN